MVIQIGNVLTNNLMAFFVVCKLVHCLIFSGALLQTRVALFMNVLLLRLEKPLLISRFVLFFLVSIQAWIAQLVEHWLEF